MFVAAFGLNFLWEMLQMPAYAELAGRSWRQTGLTCALASVGDTAITLSIYVVVALATRNWRWGTQGARKNYIVVAVLAATCAILMELVALATRRWSYLNRMPAVLFSASGSGHFYNSRYSCLSQYGSPHGCRDAQGPKPGNDVWVNNIYLKRDFVTWIGHSEVKQSRLTPAHW